MPDLCGCFWSRKKSQMAFCRLHAAARDLCEALRLLYDAQNGPPLLAPRHVEFWNAAMAAAKTALAKAEGKEPTDAR